MHPGKTEKSDLHAIVHVNLDHIPIQDDDDKAHSPPSTALPSNSTSPEEGGGEGEGGLFSPNDGNQMYLGLKAKLTRAFSSTATFTLLFIAVQILRLAQSSVPETAANFKQKLLDSCTAVDVGLNTLATQVPAHLAVTTSRLAVKAIQSSIRQTAALVSVAIQVLNWIVLFVLSRYKKLLLCFLETLLSGSLQLLGKHSDEIREALNSFLDKMKSDLNQGLTEVNNGLADVHRAGEDIFSKTIATFTGGGGGDSTTAAPAVIPLINADDFQIPESLSESLKNIHIPTLTQLKSSIGNMISIPFKVAQAEVDDRFSSLIQSTNSTTSHILGLSHSSSSSFSIAPPTGFCAEKIDTRWIDTVADACIKALHIGLIIIAVLAIVFTLANAVKIWLEHRKMERRVARLTAKLGLHMQHDSQQQQHPRMHPEILSREVLRYAQDPTFHVVSKSIGKRLGGSNNKNSQYKWRWFLDYIHHEPSLSILGFGILGVLVILLQIWLLYFTTQQLIPTLADKIAASANHIVSTVSESMTKAMVVMFDPVNQHIAAVEQRANEAVDAFVDDVAYPLNRTLRTIMSGFKHTIAEAFHAVPVLETAILGFGGCVLGIDGSGIDSFDDSIQEIKSKLRFTFVRLDADTAGIPESQMEKSVLGILHSHESDQERLASTASSSSLLSSSSTTIDPSSNTATTSNSSTFSSSATIKSWIESQVQKFVKRVEKTLRMSLWPFYDMIAFGVVVPCLGVLRIFIWVISDCVQKCKNKGNNSNNSSTGMRGGGCCGKRRSKKHT